MKSRTYHLHRLEQHALTGELDSGLLPFLRRINRNPWLCTTQSCNGHGGPGPGFIQLETLTGSHLEACIPALIRVKGVDNIDKTWAFNDDREETWFTIFFDPGALPGVLEDITTILEES